LESWYKKKYVRIKVSVAGSEDGTIYKFVLSDGKEISVTETHPMKILHNEVFQNIAAKDVKVGDISETINNKQKIINIEKLTANGSMVYNFEYDLDNIPVNLRTIIANGVYTLDLFAQKQNENDRKK